MYIASLNRKPSGFLGGLAVLIVLGLSDSGVAQLPTSVSVTSQYPRSASQAVLSERGTPTLHPGVDLAFVGLGGQVAVVRANVANLSLWSGADDQIYVNGFVHDLAIVRDTASPARDRVYAAAGIGRVASVNLDPQLNEYELQFTEGGAIGDYVRSIAAVDVLDGVGAKKRVVFAGTRDSDIAGVIRAYFHANQAGTLQTMSTYATTPVYTLAASTLLTSDNKVTLLAGTACGGLLRFDIPQSVLAAGTGFTLSSYLTNSWTPSGSTAFVRDIVVNETHEIAFVACHSKGIFAFDVGGSGTLAPFGSPWPIAPNPIPPTNVPDERFDGLALSPDGKYLVAALGPQFSEEQQQWGTCSQKLACDGALNAPAATVSGRGLRVYEVDSGGGYAAGWNLHTHYPTTESGEALRPLAVAIRGRDDDNFDVDVAADAGGFLVKTYDIGASPRTFTSHEAGFGLFDNVLLGSADDVSLHTIGSNTALYVSIEKGLATFNMSSGQFSTVPTIAQTAAVILSANTTWSTPYLLGGTDDGVSLFDLTNPLVPVNLSAMFNTEGRGHIWLQAMVTPSSVSPVRPLAYVVNKDEELSSTTEGPGVRMWNLNLALQTGDASNARSSAIYVDETSFPGTPTNRTFGGMVAADLGTGLDHVLYVGYGPDKRLVDPGGGTVASANDKIGLVVLKATWDPVLGPSIVRVPQGSSLDVEAVSGLSGNEPLGRATRSGNDVYVAYGCYGVAKFDVSSPLAPNFIAHRPSPSGATAIQAIRIGNHVFTTYLGVNYFSVEDASTFGTGLVSAPLRTHFQPINIISAGVSDSYFSADGRGGVVRFMTQ